VSAVAFAIIASIIVVLCLYRKNKLFRCCQEKLIPFALVKCCCFKGRVAPLLDQDLGMRNVNGSGSSKGNRNTAKVDSSQEYEGNGRIPTDSQMMREYQ